MFVRVIINDTASDVVFAAPTSMMLMELVAGRSGNQVPLEALWQAILGTTDQFQRGNISEDLYDMYHRELTVCHELFSTVRQ